MRMTIVRSVAFRVNSPPPPPPPLTDSIDAGPLTRTSRSPFQSCEGSPPAQSSPR